MINGIHHTALSCRDMERSLAFYRDLLGAKVVFDGGWPAGTEMADKVTRLEGSACRQVMLLMGNAYIELFQYHAPEPMQRTKELRVCDHGWTHLCLDVTDIQAEYRRMQNAGVDLHCEPQRVTESTFTFYMRDPDGNVVELQEVLPGSVDDRVIGVPTFQNRLISSNS